MASKTVLFIFTVLMGAVLWGCPYDSTVPLSPPEEADIDLSLTGTWVLKETPDASGFINILPFNGHELLIVVRENEKQDMYRAFTTTFGGEKFLNLRQIGAAAPGAAPWNFVNYSTAGDRLTYRIVEDTIPEREKLSREAFIARIEKDPGNRELYDDDSGGVLVRTHSMK